MLVLLRKSRWHGANRRQTTRVSKKIWESDPTNGMLVHLVAIYKFYLMPLYMDTLYIYIYKASCQVYHTVYHHHHPRGEGVAMCLQLRKVV